MTKNTEKYCTKCKKLKKLSSDYYLAANTTINSDGKLCICKNCLESIVNMNDMNSLKNIMRMIDRPFLIEEFEGSFVSNPNKPFAEYMRRLAMKQNRDKTWDDSEFKKMIIEDNRDSTTTMNDQETLNELINFFGRGFIEEDYYWLQNEYTDFLNRYECDSKGMEMLITEICLTRLDIKKRRSLGEKVDAQLKTLQDLLGSSNLKPVQETGANAIEQESFGTLIKKYENEKPIPEPDPKWADVDKISKYIKVFFLGHLSRMLGIKNDYENEYWDEISRYTVEEPVNEDGGLDGRD